MSYLFSFTTRKIFRLLILGILLKCLICLGYLLILFFNEDISEWDTSNVINMRGMFSKCPFNRDLSKWDTSNVTNMNHMFDYNKNFNCKILNWNTFNVKYMNSMFHGSSFNQDISFWNVKKVKEAQDIFWMSSFNQDISALAKQNPLFKDTDYLGLI